MVMNLQIFGLFLLCLFYGGNLFAQVEHNYRVTPENTSCDSLQLQGVEKSRSIELLQSTSFRTSESMKLRRKSGLREANYYSCDNNSGYLLIRYNEEYQIYQDVSLTTWKELIGTADPEGFYMKSIKPVFKTPQY